MSEKVIEAAVNLYDIMWLVHPRSTLEARTHFAVGVQAIVDAAVNDALARYSTEAVLHGKLRDNLAASHESIAALRDIIGRQP